MTWSCGVNDVWHGVNGVPLENHKKNITAIVDKAQAAGVKIVILTSTLIREDQANPENQKLVGDNEFLRTLAAEKKCLLSWLCQSGKRLAPPLIPPKSNRLSRFCMVRHRARLWSK